MDRIDVSIKLQSWQHFFMRALAGQNGVSNDESAWGERDTALEYLARGRLMGALAAHVDGVDSHTGELAAEGMAQIREDTGELIEALEAVERDAAEKIQTAAGELDANKARAELRRMGELSAEHKAWYAAAKGEGGYGDQRRARLAARATEQPPKAAEPPPPEPPRDSSPMVEDAAAPRPSKSKPCPNCGAPHVPPTCQACGYSVPL